MKDGYTLLESIEILTRCLARLEAEGRAEGSLAGLSMREVLYLEAIGQLGSPSFSELAAALSLSKPSVTVMVGKLIDKGFAKKARSSTDRRLYNIGLTEKGRSLCELHNRTHAVLAGYFTSSLTGEELALLVSLLNKVVSNLPLPGAGDQPGLPLRSDSVL